MAKITLAQAKQYAANAGFTGSALNTIVAIAYAESRFITDAINPGYPAPGDPVGDHEYSVGVLQINLPAHPGITVAQAEDPQTAFRDAFQISNHGTNFNAWSTYTVPGPNNYRNFLSMVTGQPNPDPLPGVQGIAGAATNAAASLINLPNWLANILSGLGIPSLQDLGYRTLFIALGFVFLIAGVVVLFRPEEEQLFHTAEAVAPLAAGE